MCSEVLLLSEIAIIVLACSNMSIKMTDLHKDILTGLAFVTGVVGFISGEFIISSTLFAATAVASNINLNRKHQLD